MYQIKSNFYLQWKTSSTYCHISSVKLSKIMVKSLRKTVLKIPLGSFYQWYLTDPSIFLNSRMHKIRDARCSQSAVPNVPFCRHVYLSLIKLAHGFVLVAGTWPWWRLFPVVLTGCSFQRCHQMRAGRTTCAGGWQMYVCLCLQMPTTLVCTSNRMRV